jgi:Flp pilus assembly protein CpaB
VASASEALPHAGRTGARAVARRFSAGHVVLVVAATLAVVLNAAALRAADDRVRVAVAAAPIPAGATLREAAVRFADVRVDAGLLATLVAPDVLRERAAWVVTTRVSAGAPLRADDLRAPSAAAGQRAMSLPVPPEHAAGGALATGDRVDVIAVRDGAASYVVTGVEVLDVTGDGGGGALDNLRAFSVTIAVDDVAALRLAAALRTDALEVVRSTGAPPVAAGAASGPEAAGADGGGDAGGRP